MASSVSLGKGAWDCDLNAEILPDKEAIVFEEMPTMDHPFEGLPTVPARKDGDHFAFYCQGCRYRVKGSVEETAGELKRRLWEGGCGRGGDMVTGRRKIIARCVGSIGARTLEKIKEAGLLLYHVLEEGLAKRPLRPRGRLCLH